MSDGKWQGKLRGRATLVDADGNQLNLRDAVIEEEDTLGSPQDNAYTVESFTAASGLVNTKINAWITSLEALYVD
jgi:hypothetical protein